MAHLLTISNRDYSEFVFEKNKTQWSGHIRGQAMRTIADPDYELITKAAEIQRD